MISLLIVLFVVGCEAKITYTAIPSRESMNAPTSKCLSSCDDRDICTEDTCSFSTDYKCNHIKLDPCCGNNICEKDETIQICNKDCKGIDITLNSYELLYKFGEIPPAIKGILKYQDEEQRKNTEQAYIKTPQDGNIFFVLDLTITNLDPGEAYFLMDVDVKDKRGYIFDFSQITFNLNDYLRDASIKQNEKLRGKMIYEVPADLKEFELIVHYDYEGTSASFSKKFNI